jgi:beta-mannosidase
MEKRTFDLGGSWEFKEFPESARRMRDLDEGQWTPTQAPSSIFSSLIEGGCFSRFDLEANPEDFGWVSERAWVYRKRFELNAAFCDSDSISLVFEGLDTITQIWLNEKLIGKTENMFVGHRFEVKDRVRPGPNVLMVKFLSATDHAERLMQRYGKLSDHHFGDPRRSYVRKAQYQFGSAMGPALPGCGIFRPVRLEACTTARIDDVYIRTIDCNEHYADVRAAIRIQRVAGQENTPLSLRLSLGGGGLAMEQALRFGPEETQNTTVIRIERPIFWQPAGYGVPHLYHLTAALVGPDDTLLDSSDTDFGIRSIRLMHGNDGRGHTFRFEINDSPVYIQGANWMPLSMLPGTQTTDDYERLLTAIKKAHINMLRVWGGGVYEDDAFYHLCDRLGILVWQDFAFASAYYPDRQWFMDMVETEAQTVVRRLRNHACLALWCGNSRIDHLHESGRLGDGRKFYGRAIYHELLPALLGELDPDRDYLPTTPFSEGETKDLNAPTDGTCHRWDVWNAFGSTREYLFEKSHIPRFLCEFGLQSLPGMECLKRICSAGRLASGSAAIEKHNYQADSDGRMARYCAELFAPPHDLDEQIEQTQLAQARGVKLCAERLRANNHINGGLLLWTANDCAPSAGFSAIDFCGQPKALYYYMRRFFAPTLVTLEVDQDAWLTPCLKGDGIVVVNDSPRPLTATVQCRCMDFYGRSIDTFEYPVAVGPFSKSSPRSLPRALACPQTPSRSLLHIEVVNASGVITENRFYYLPDKHLDWPATTLDLDLRSVEPSCWQLTLIAPTVVRDVTVFPPAAAILSDNYFDLLPGRPHTLRIQFAGDAPSTRIPLSLRSIPCGLF